MQLSRIYLNNFRNYDHLELNINKRINILFGKNAQGKTGILEAVYYLSLLTSYRTNQDNELIKHSASEFSIAANYRNNLDDNYSISVKKSQITKKRECLINSIAFTNKDFIGELKAVAFSPDDLEIIKGEPSIRRKFLNIQISRINKYYYSLLVKFNIIIKHRNKLLKDIRENTAKTSSLAIWDCEYAQIALEIIRLRTEFLTEFLPIVYEIFIKLTDNFDEKLHCLYKTNVLNNTNSDSFITDLQQYQDNDIKRGSTALGPHKDDFIFSINDYEAGKFASQGQQRSIVLALKLAEIVYIKNKTGEYPVLLLDDVLSELDEQKKAKLLQYLNKNVQVFITVTERELLPLNCLNHSEIDLFEVKNATLQRGIL